MSSGYNPDHYEQVTKLARQRSKLEKVKQDAKANGGVIPRRKGPPRKYNGESLTLHIKFSGDVANYIEQQSRETGYQAYIEGLVRHEREQPFALSPRTRERIRNALLWHEGYVAEDEQVEEKARSIAAAAWDQYCTAIERESDNPLIS